MSEHVEFAQHIDITGKNRHHFFGKFPRRRSLWFPTLCLASMASHYLCLSWCLAPLVRCGLYGGWSNGGLCYCWWQPEIRARKPVEGKVVYPIISLFTRVLAPSNRWLVFGMIFMTGAKRFRPRWWMLGESPSWWCEVFWKNLSENITPTLVNDFIFGAVAG